MLFADKLNIEVTPESEGPGFRVRYGWDSRTPNRATRPLSLTPFQARHLPKKEGGRVCGPLEGSLTFRSASGVRPGIDGTIRIKVTPVEQSLNWSPQPAPQPVAALYSLGRTRESTRVSAPRLLGPLRFSP